MVTTCSPAGGAAPPVLGGLAKREGRRRKREEDREGRRGEGEEIWNRELGEGGGKEGYGDGEREGGRVKYRRGE